MVWNIDNVYRCMFGSYRYIAMNDKIKELAEKAGFVLWGEEIWNPGDAIDWSSGYDDELTKYTEFLIQECMSYLEEGDIDYAKFMIKKNFGIE